MLEFNCLKVLRGAGKNNSGIRHPVRNSGRAKNGCQTKVIYLVVLLCKTLEILIRKVLKHNRALPHFLCVGVNFPRCKLHLHDIMTLQIARPSIASTVHFGSPNHRSFRLSETTQYEIRRPDMKSSTSPKEPSVICETS
jgi:hypothetical protein